jgi:hypothetical protein
MIQKRAILSILMISFLAVACTRAKPELATPKPGTTPGTYPPPATEPSATLPTSATSVFPSATPETSVCELVTRGNLTAYDRPSIRAEVFSTMQPGLRVYVEARTADGWIGFDPGYAQAGNVGVFRMRWIREGGAFDLEGECAALPIVEGPPPGVCFAMCMGDTPVRAQPNSTASAALTLGYADYAKVLGASGDWLRVDLSVGNVALDQQGWVARDEVGLNGPCEDLPLVQP